MLYWEGHSSATGSGTCGGFSLITISTKHILIRMRGDNSKDGEKKVTDSHDQETGVCVVEGIGD